MSEPIEDPDLRDPGPHPFEQDPDGAEGRCVCGRPVGHLFHRVVAPEEPGG